MRDHLDVIACDTPGCDAEIVAVASELRGRAEATGWQVAVELDSGADDLRRVDHCPSHHLDRWQATGPIQVWDL